MANSSIPIQDAAEDVQDVDVFTLVGGDIRTSVVIGDPSDPDGAAPVTAALGLRVHDALASTATLANVNASASSVTLQAALAGRRALIIFNDSTVTLRIKYGSAASATSFTHLLMAGEERTITNYSGIVTGIWDSATGVARMTELTA